MPNSFEIRKTQQKLEMNKRYKNTQVVEIWPGIFIVSRKERSDLMSLCTYAFRRIMRNMKEEVDLIYPVIIISSEILTF